MNHAEVGISAYWSPFALRCRLAANGAASKAVSLFCACVIGLSPMRANAGALEELPTEWRLSAYASGEVSIYYSSSPCTDGILRLLPGDSDAVKDRLTAIVLTAKAIRKKVGVFFDEANGCRISSFYLKEGAE